MESPRLSPMKVYDSLSIDYPSRTLHSPMDELHTPHISCSRTYTRYINYSGTEESTMPTNQELQATITALQKELDTLKKKESQMERSTTTLVGISDTFENRVWEAVLIGAVSTLFDPSRISIDNRPKALNHYLARALRIADEAVVVAKAHTGTPTTKEPTKEPGNPLDELLQ